MMDRHNTTVTMPLSEYKAMEGEINRLEEKYKSASHSFYVVGLIMKEGVPVGSPEYYKNITIDEFILVDKVLNILAEKKLPGLHSQLLESRDRIVEIIEENKRLKSRGLIARIFNW